MPSQAAAPTRPWPRAASPAAIAMPKPEAIATQLVPVQRRLRPARTLAWSS